MAVSTLLIKSAKTWSRPDAQRSTWCRLALVLTSASKLFHGMPSKVKSQPLHWPKHIQYIISPCYHQSVTSSARQFIVESPTRAQKITPTRKCKVVIRPITLSSHPACGQYGLFATQKIPPKECIMDYMGRLTFLNPTYILLSFIRILQVKFTVMIAPNLITTCASIVSWMGVALASMQVKWEMRLALSMTTGALQKSPTPSSLIHETMGASCGCISGVPRRSRKETKFLYPMENLGGEHAKR